MKLRPPTVSGGRLRGAARAWAWALAGAGALLAPAGARAAVSTSAPSIAGKPIASATVTQCVTASEESERAVTFAGEMSAVPGSTRMEMRIDLQERAPGQSAYHVVDAPGLGVWRGAVQGAGAFRYLRRVTNLAAPATYRGDVRFRWMSSRDHPIRTLELLTPRCQQPLLEPGEGAPGAALPTPAGG